MKTLTAECDVNNKPGVRYLLDKTKNIWNGIYKFRVPMAKKTKKTHHILGASGCTLKYNC